MHVFIFVFHVSPCSVCVWLSFSSPFFLISFVVVYDCIISSKRKQIVSIASAYACVYVLLRVFN